MSNVYVMDNNYVNSDFYSAMTYSSQLTTCPASNVLDGVRRTKVWRTAGYWVVTSGNKGIVLQTTASVNQTVNIAEGTYTTDATFLAAVATALNSESSSAVFTVTRNTTTNKIVLTSDGAGGTVFRLMCTNASFTAAALLGFSTGSDLTGALTYTQDTLKINTEEWLKWDFGVAVNPKAFAMIGLRNSALKLSDTAVIKLQANASDSWTSPSLNSTLTYGEFGVTSYNTAGLGSYRYWRLYILDQSNVNDYLEISNVYLGDIVTTTQGAAQFPLEIETVDIGSPTSAISGVSYHDDVQLTDSISLSWNYLSSSEKQDMDDHFRYVGLSKPWFIELDPDQNFTDDINRSLKFVKFTSGPSTIMEGPNRFSSRWQMREEV